MSKQRDSHAKKDPKRNARGLGEKKVREMKNVFVGFISRLNTDEVESLS